MFDIIETTIDRYHEALLSGEITCEAVVSTYLERIKQTNKTLRAIIHLNTKSLERARELDRKLKDEKTSTLPPLYGVPIILKDTYGTEDLPTTSGSKSLVGLKTKDAFVVTKFRNAGAIIIGKGNCQEFCLGGWTMSSLGGQTLNPYDLTRTPGGSSGGSAVAIAANLVMVGCGGDTMNSIRSPASACNLVGLKPTMGEISRAGIVPNSWTQDTAGPLGRSVSDVRRMFNVMRGEDPDDEATLRVDNANHSRGHLSARPRIGLLSYYFPTPGENEDADSVLQVANGAVERLKENFELVYIPSSDLETDLFHVPTLMAKADIQKFELAPSINNFLSSKFVVESPHKDLTSIYESGNYIHDILRAPFSRALEFAVSSEGGSPEYNQHLQYIRNLDSNFNNFLDEHNLDAVIFPHQRRLVMKAGLNAQLDRQGLLAALTGCPSLCIPGGFTSSTENAPIGVPVGIEVVGRRGADDMLLDIGEQMMDVLKTRKPPIIA